MIVFSKYPKKHLCQVRGCTNDRTPRRNMCCKHCRQYTKENSPVSYYYGNMKQNAKRRGIPFLLTLAQFKAFCNRTGYLQTKGKEIGCMQIDRKRECKGYQVGNIQLLTVTENVIKQRNYERTNHH